MQRISLGGKSMTNILPKLDEKVETILKGLAEGKTREQIAAEFGNSNWKSVDMYMRRRDYTWDSQKQTYVYELEVEKAIPQMKDTSKAGKVIYFLQQEDIDPKDVAIRLGFKNHRDMAEYMKVKGYEWHSEVNNYRKQTGWVEEQPASADTNGMSPVPTVPANYSLPQDLQHYLPLLQLLDEHKEQLAELLRPVENAQIPRYLVPGVARTKTIQMMNTLHDLIADYCNEFNIQQRVLFEVALIEFFMKYGFKREVELMMKK